MLTWQFVACQQNGIGAPLVATTNDDKLELVHGSSWNLDLFIEPSGILVSVPVADHMRIWAQKPSELRVFSFAKKYCRPFCGSKLRNGEAKSELIRKLAIAQHVVCFFSIRYRCDMLK